MNQKLKIASILGVGILLGMMGQGIAESFVQINIGSETPQSTSALTRRIYNLERAVLQLQGQIYPQLAAPATPPVTCFIETPFDGVIRSTRSTKGEALGSVLEACSKKTNNGLACKESKVRCE